MSLKFYFAKEDFVDATVMVIQEEKWSDGLSAAYLDSRATHIRFEYGLFFKDMDFAFLRELPPESVEGIYVGVIGSFDISVLEHFPNLRLISLEQYVGRTNMKRWKNLEVLQLKYKKTVSDFVNLPKLHTLYMNNIPGEDFSMIGGMTQLKTLSIHGGKQTSANGLQHLKNLEYLELYRLKHMQDWSALIEDYPVKRINVEKCGVVDYVTSKEAFMKAVKAHTIVT